MIDKTHFTQMAKKVFHHEQGIRDPHIMHPEREWLIGLGGMIAVFVACAFWSGQVYMQHKNITAGESTATNSSEATYREPQVKEALRLVSERDAELQGLLGVTPTLPVEPLEIPVATSSEVAEEVLVDEAATSTTDAVE